MDYESLPTSIKTKKFSAREILGLVLSEGQPTFKRWKTKQDREIAKLKRDKASDLEGEKVFKYISMILQHMTMSVGGKDLWLKDGPDYIEKMNYLNRCATFSQMYSCDALLMYLKLKASVKEIATVTVSHKKLGKDVSLDFNLLDVGVLLPDCDDPSQLKIENFLYKYVLDEHMYIGSKEVSYLILGPAKWGKLEHFVDGDVNDADIAIRQLAASVYAIPEFIQHSDEYDTTYPIQSLEMLDDLDKPDLDKLTNLISEHDYGPDMGITIEKDGEDIKLNTSWMTSDFLS